MTITSLPHRRCRRHSRETYAWLNHVQCVGKVVEVKVGENLFVKYDIYIVR